MKQFLIIVLILVIIGLVGLYVITGKAPNYEREEAETTAVLQDDRDMLDEQQEMEEKEVMEAGAEEEMDNKEDTARSAETVLGTSAGGNAITAHHYGAGEDELLFVGGIHGGYAWNTALVAYELMEYLEANPDAVPDNVTVTVIPVLNPDGLEKVVGTTGKFSQSKVPKTQAATIPGRFNDNTVDLNRNFDCDWKQSGTWQQQTVSGGDAPFSEPETIALRDYVSDHEPTAVVAYYSAAGGVFASNCRNGVLLETRTLTNLYANASGYTAYEEFDFYEVTGDMVNWFAKNGVPAISVLLTSHDTVEWTKNQRGITALLNHYAKE